MSPKRSAAESAETKDNAPDPPPAPVNVVDGVPDRSPRRAVWKLLALLGAFVAWLAVLVYVAAAGRP